MNACYAPPHAPNLLCGLFVAVFPPLTGFASSLLGVGFVPPMPAEATFCTPGRATRMDSERWDRARKPCARGLCRAHMDIGLMLLQHGRTVGMLNLAV